MKVTEIPELHDLTWLFESEPVLADADVPLPYNTVTVTHERDGERLSVLMSPAYRDVQVHWKRGDRELLGLVLTHVRRVSIEAGEEGEALLVELDDPKFKALIVRTKPSISVHWAMDFVEAD